MGSSPPGPFWLQPFTRAPQLSLRPSLLMSMTKGWSHMPLISGLPSGMRGMVAALAARPKIIKNIFTSRPLAPIPIQQPDINPGAVQRLLESHGIGALVVIGLNNRRMECAHRVRGLFGRHGVGQIHADESDIDI